MIRNETQRRRAQAEKEELAATGSGEQEEQETRRLMELDSELAEYEALRSGEVDEISGEGVETLGEMLVKARLARGLTHAELGDLLSMTEQQIGRYEKEAWRRASLWRLEEVANVLGLRVKLEAKL